MKWPLFENKIRKALLSHQSEVDVDAIWAAIEPGVDAINRRKKRRFMLFWLLLPLLVAHGIGFYIYLNDGTYENKATTALNTIASTNNKVVDKSALNAPKNPIETQQTQEGSSHKTGQSSHNGGALTTTENQGLNAKAGNPIFLNKKGKKPSYKTATATSDQPKRNANLGPAAAPASPIAEQAPNTGRWQTEYPGPNAAEAPIAGQNTVNAMPTTTAQRLLEAVPTLPFEPLSAIAPKLPALPPTALEQPLETPPLRKRDFRLTAAVLGSISFLDRKMTATDSAYTTLLDLRERSERQLEAVQAGIRIGVEHRSGLGFSTGLNYAQLNEVYRYKSIKDSIETVNGIQYYYLNFENDTIPVYGDIQLERRTTHRKEFYNKYRLIEVPLLVSWRHEGHQFSFGAQAGAFVNLRMAATGRVLQSATQDVDISSGGLYRTNIGLSYYLGLTAGFMLNDRLEVVASPFVRHFPKSFTKASYGLEQRYNLYGLNVGLGVRF
ncbi:MAG: hypothetical protein IPN76_23420 [Saprospiraceae bacterium]|nr:hypothetical protein [Saprospiraceae bacterium]